VSGQRGAAERGIRIYTTDEYLESLDESGPRGGDESDLRPPDRPAERRRASRGLARARVAAGVCVAVGGASVVATVHLVGGSRSRARALAQRLASAKPGRRLHNEPFAASAGPRAVAEAASSRRARAAGSRGKRPDEAARRLRARRRLGALDAGAQRSRTLQAAPTRAHASVRRREEFGFEAVRS
jgi:hypothetical protein